MIREQLLMLLYPDELKQVKKQIENLKLKSYVLDDFIDNYFNIFSMESNNYANIFITTELNKDKEFQKLLNNLILYSVNKFLDDDNNIDISQDDINKVLDNALLKIDSLIDEQQLIIKNNGEFIELREIRELL